MNKEAVTDDKSAISRVKHYLGNFAKLYVFVNSAAFFAGLTAALMTKIG